MLDSAAIKLNVRRTEMLGVVVDDNLINRPGARGILITDDATTFVLDHRMVRVCGNEIFMQGDATVTARNAIELVVLSNATASSSAFSFSVSNNMIQWATDGADPSTDATSILLDTGEGATGQAKQHWDVSHNQIRGHRKFGIYWRMPDDSFSCHQLKVSHNTIRASAAVLTDSVDLWLYWPASGEAANTIISFNNLYGHDADGHRGFPSE